MISVLLSLTISGFVCPPVPCATIFVEGDYVLCCYDGRAIEPVTLCGDGCIRIELDSDANLSVWSRRV
jgi:hypothetical protein